MLVQFTKGIGDVNPSRGAHGDTRGPDPFRGFGDVIGLRDCCVDAKFVAEVEEKFVVGVEEKPVADGVGENTGRIDMETEN